MVNNNIYCPLIYCQQIEYALPWPGRAEKVLWRRNPEYEISCLQPVLSTRNILASLAPLILYTYVHIGLSLVIYG